VIDITPSRFQHAVIATLLILVLHVAAMPTMVSAADQEMPRRHSLLHHSTIESAVPSATTHGTIFQYSNDEPGRITSYVGPPIAAIIPPTIAFPPHRTLTKHPPIASVTAPVPPFHITLAVPTSDIAAGQITQTTTNTGHGTTPTTPATTSMPPLPAGMTSTSTNVVIPITPYPLAGAAGIHSTASTGSRTASFGSSRSILNLFKNSAIASLLQPETPVITVPPSPPPRSTPPSTSPPPNGSTGNVTLAWKANREPDLAGYKLYIGTASGRYDFAGSPFLTDIATSYVASNLPKGQTYFFALAAYDSAGNESELSAEISKTLY